MHYYIAGRKSDQSFVYFSGMTSALIPDANAGAFLADEFGGNPTDYSLYRGDSDTPEGIRVNQGDEYVLVWTANEITGLDFTTQDNKRWLKVAVAADTVLADGVDTVAVTLEVWDKDLVAIEPLNLTREIPVDSPQGQVRIRITLVNGVATVNFKTTQAGYWKFPTSVRELPGGTRVVEVKVIDAILVI